MIEKEFPSIFNIVNYIVNYHEESNVDEQWLVSCQIEENECFDINKISIKFLLEELLIYDLRGSWQ